MSEKLSLIVDGEFRSSGDERAIPDCDEAALRTIERYQLIGALLRNDRPDAAINAYTNDLSGRISATISAEKGWQLPADQSAALPAGARRNIRRRHGRSIERRGAFFGGFAVAAAISALAVFVFLPNSLDSTGKSDTRTVIADSSTSTSLNPMNVAELSARLVEHGEFTGSAGLNGLLAYAKFVSHDDSR